MKHTDDWIENRIRFWAGKHQLPAGRTCFFSEASLDTRFVVAYEVSSVDVDALVLLGYDSPKRWTVLGTRHLAGIADERFGHVKYSDIASIASRGFPPPEDVGTTLSRAEFGRLKRSWEYLQISDHDGRAEDFWVPAGSEAFAFLNILLRLSRMVA